MPSNPCIHTHIRKCLEEDYLFDFAICIFFTVYLFFRATLRRLTLLDHQPVKYTSLPNTLEVLRLRAPIRAHGLNRWFDEPELWFPTAFPQLHTLYLESEYLSPALFQSLAEHCPSLKFLYLSDPFLLRESLILEYVHSKDGRRTTFKCKTCSATNKAQKSRFRRHLQRMRGLVCLLKRGCTIEYQRNSP